jgi:hypothetical protein
VHAKVPQVRGNDISLLYTCHVEDVQECGGGMGAVAKEGGAAVGCLDVCSERKHGWGAVLKRVPSLDPGVALVVWVVVLGGSAGNVVEYRLTGSLVEGVGAVCTENDGGVVLACCWISVVVSLHAFQERLDAFVGTCGSVCCASREL